MKTDSSPGHSLAPQTAAMRKMLPEEFLRDKKYDIGGMVARGGMGAILDATEATIERKVAMKVMLDNSSQEDLARFVAEAKITGQLEHPNIVPVHELNVDENEQVFYTMKFVKIDAAGGAGKAARGRCGDGSEILPWGLAHHFPKGLRCARLCPQQAGHSSRLEAGEHHGRRLWRGAGHGLGPGQGARRQESIRGAVCGGRNALNRAHGRPRPDGLGDAGRRDHGHAAVHEPRTGARRSRKPRCPQRHLCTRGDSLPHPHAVPALRGRKPRRYSRPGALRQAHAAQPAGVADEEAPAGSATSGSGG